MKSSEILLVSVSICPCSLVVTVTIELIIKLLAVHAARTQTV